MTTTDIIIPTDDFSAAVSHCRVAQSVGREISDSCARVIASMYHDGQASESYAFTSTGVILSDDLWREFFPTYSTPNAGYAALSADERLLADMMGTYLGNRRIAGNAGPVNGWSTLWLYRRMAVGRSTY